MDDNIRRAALRATAKVALSFTVMACGGVAQVPSTNSDDAIADDPSQELTPPTDAYEAPVAVSYLPASPPEEELACNAPLPGEVTEADAEQLNCCTEHLETVFPSGGDWESWLESAAEPSAQACCNVVIAGVGFDWELIDQVGGDTVYACCEALGFPSSPACTPWGPPVPPAVDRLPQLVAARLVA